MEPDTDFDREGFERLPEYGDGLIEIYVRLD